MVFKLLTGQGSSFMVAASGRVAGLQFGPEVGSRSPVLQQAIAATADRRLHCSVRRMMLLRLLSERSYGGPARKRRLLCVVAGCSRLNEEPWSTCVAAPLSGAWLCSCAGQNMTGLIELTRIQCRLLAGALVSSFFAAETCGTSRTGVREFLQYEAQPHYSECSDDGLRKGAQMCALSSRPCPISQGCAVVSSASAVAGTGVGPRKRLLAGRSLFLESGLARGHHRPLSMPSKSGKVLSCRDCLVHVRSRGCNAAMSACEKSGQWQTALHLRPQAGPARCCTSCLSEVLRMVMW